MSSTNNVLVKLQKQMDVHFSDEELKDICFSLDLDYANLPSETKKGKIRELIKHLKRRGQLQNLTPILKTERPHVNWPDPLYKKQAPLNTPSIPPFPQANTLKIKPTVLITLLLLIALLLILTILDPFAPEPANPALPTTALTKTTPSTLALQETPVPSKTAIVISPTPLPTLILTRQPMKREKDGMLMLYIPSGSFEIGSDESAPPFVITRHEVTVTHFFIDATEVSTRQFLLFLEGNYHNQPENVQWFLPKTSANGFIDLNEDGDFILSSGGTHAMNWVTWYGANAYCQWVGGRLPTEEEWEYATRGPESLRFAWGNEYDGSQANTCDETCSRNDKNVDVNDGHRFVAGVNSYPKGKSWRGLFNMIGNVAEWTASNYLEDNNIKVVRGGSWNNPRADSLSTYRDPEEKSYAGSPVGFRCAYDVET